MRASAYPGSSGNDRWHAWVPALRHALRPGRRTEAVMFQAYGLYGHIQANRIRSVILLIGFVVLLQALLFSFNLIWAALAYGGDLDEIFAYAGWQFGRTWPFAMLGAA